MTSDTTSQRYRDAYLTFNERYGAELSPIQDVRQTAWELFAKQGLPRQSRGNELWKYANLQPIVSTDFSVPSSPSGALTQAQLGELYGWDFTYPTAVIVDGFYDEKLSTASSVSGVRLMSLTDALREAPELVMQNLSRITRVGDEDNAFINLNTALIGGAVVCIVADGTQLSEPIQIISVMSAGEVPRATFPRTLFIVGDNAEVSLLETSLGLGGAYLSAGVTEIALGRSSKLNHYRAQLDKADSYQINHTRVRQAEGSDYNAVSLSRGAALGRYDVHVGLYGERANCDLFGLYLTKGTEHHGSEISTTHAVPHCTSKQYYKGILSGTSRAVFSGKVVVHKGAIKTDAEQKDLNLLLSRGAEIDTKPSLEIYADDVKCGHGATAGHLDESTLFYLRSRGLSMAEAMRIQTLGFASEVLERADNQHIADFYSEVLSDELPKLLAQSDLMR